MALVIGGKYGKKGGEREGRILNPATIFQAIRQSGGNPHIQRIGLGVWEGTTEPSYQFQKGRRNYKTIADRTYQDDLYVEDKRGFHLPIGKAHTKMKFIIHISKADATRRLGSKAFLARLITDEQQWYGIAKGGTLYDDNPQFYEFHSAVFSGEDYETIFRNVQTFQNALSRYGVYSRMEIVRR